MMLRLAAKEVPIDEDCRSLVATVRRSPALGPNGRKSRKRMSNVTNMEVFTTKVLEVMNFSIQTHWLVL